LIYTGFILYQFHLRENTKRRTSELKERAFTRKCKAHRLFWSDRENWRIIPLSNTAEYNWASAVGLVPTVELKGFRTPQQDTGAKNFILSMETKKNGKIGNFG
jgi:hypothetical protein